MAGWRRACCNLRDGVVQRHVAVWQFVEHARGMVDFPVAVYRVRRNAIE